MGRGAIDFNRSENLKPVVHASSLDINMICDRCGNCLVFIAYPPPFLPSHNNGGFTMGKQLVKKQVQLAVNSTPEQSEEYGVVLCQLRGVSKEAAANLKSFKLDLGAFNGEVPEQYDGLAVELIIDPENDQQTAKYVIPANFKVLDIKEGAYVPTKEAIDMDAYLKSLGIV